MHEEYKSYFSCRSELSESAQPYTSMDSPAFSLLRQQGAYFFVSSFHNRQMNGAAGARCCKTHATGRFHDVSPVVELW